MSLKLIDHFELTTQQSSVVIDNIPQDYTHLVVKMSAKIFRTGSYGLFYMQLNDDTSSVYYTTRLRNQGGSITGQSFGGSANGAGPGYNTYNSVGGSIFSSSTLLFPNYTTTGAKTWMAETYSPNTSADGAHTIARLHSTATPAITKMEFKDGNGSNFLAKSAFTIYGILRDSNGSITVS